MTDTINSLLTWAGYIILSIGALILGLFIVLLTVSLIAYAITYAIGLGKRSIRETEEERERFMRHGR